MTAPVLESVLTCPKCGFAKAETQRRRLLRVLLFRFGEVPADTSPALPLEPVCATRGGLYESR